MWSTIFKDHDASAADTTKGVVLLLQVPRTNDKKELAAEQMFASLHGLLTNRSGLHERISLEIAVLQKKIGFYVWVPHHIKDFVEDQIYAQYPQVQISEVEDYSANPNASYQTVVGNELLLTANAALPIKTFANFEVDPLASITGTLAKFSNDEEAWIQLLIKPAKHNWHRRSESYISQVKNGQENIVSYALSTVLGSSEHDVKRDLTEYDKTRISGAEQKSHKLAYTASLRIIYRGNATLEQANLRLQSITASYKQFNTTYLNGFRVRQPAKANAALSMYHDRSFSKHVITLNIEELATLYHLPHTNVETPYIRWAASQTAEPPESLPLIEADNYDAELISPFGITNFRGHNSIYGMSRQDRGRHLYIIGQTGVGKSALLELLTMADLHSAHGLAVMDPHGDYAISTLQRIPKERINDVVYFNPADIDFPMAFNPMELTDPKLRLHTASELIGVLKRMFDSWGPRLEYILRYSILALLDYPEATMLDIVRLLTDEAFRADVLKYVTDIVVINFWEVEFKSWNKAFAAEAVAPILNKVGAFTANPLVRNIIGQPHSSFNIRQIMDQKKILIINLSRGIIGEDNASILGALLVTKIQLAAMSRADTPVENRHPFYLYVDEFQNFATDSFTTILSEARKYGLNLTVANQYIAQMSQEVREAVFGNVGTLINFRVGADDATKLQKYFDGSFSESDLINLNNRHFVTSMTINGEKARPFSALTLDLPPHEASCVDQIIANSRRLYAHDRQSVELHIKRHYGAYANAGQASIAMTKSVQELGVGASQYSNELPLVKKRKRTRRKKNTMIHASQERTISIHDVIGDHESTLLIR